jgi:hypothetical protein
MAFPRKICAVCAEEFELKPDKPGFADRCPACSTPEKAEPATQRKMDAPLSASLQAKQTLRAGKRCAICCIEKTVNRAAQAPKCPIFSYPRLKSCA